MLMQVEQAALGPRVRRRLAFIDDDPDAAAMQGAREHQAAEARTNDGNVFSHLSAFLNSAGQACVAVDGAANQLSAGVCAMVVLTTPSFFAARVVYDKIACLATSRPHDALPTSRHSTALTPLRRTLLYFAI
jgi:hypothetical protein